MSSVVRELEFFIDKDKKKENGTGYEIGSPAVKFHVEELNDRSLRVTASLFDNDKDGRADTADIIGLYFHIGDVTEGDEGKRWLEGLSITSSDGVPLPVVKKGNGVVTLGEGNNMEGRPIQPYDVGIAVGSTGRGRNDIDDITKFTFILKHTQSLKLEDLAGKGFGARLQSVGEEGSGRGSSLKLWGDAVTGSIGDRVWLDTDEDGVQDEGELGVAGIAIELLDANGTVLSQTTTTETGNYLFAGLTYGDYKVRFAPDSTYQLTQRDRGSDVAADSDADVLTGLSGTYTISDSNRHITTVDAGLTLKTDTTKTGSIGDRVWLDADRDGVQDADEAGLEGVTVQLLDANGVLLKETQTAASGNYLFDGLAYGTYTVRFVPGGAYQPTQRDAGTDDAADSDADARGQTGSYKIDDANQHIRGVDAGLHAVETTSPVEDETGDDLIEAGDGDDRVYGGGGNDEIQGEGGDDIITGGKDRGSLGWDNTTLALTKVVIGDNLYGNHGNDTIRYAKGDGVDLIWDFQPGHGEDVIEVTGYAAAQLDHLRVAWVGDVANWIGTPNHKKLMLIFGDGGAIAFNDYAGRNDSTADAIKFIGADGEVLKALSITKLREMAEDSPVAVNLINNPDVPLRTYRKHDLGAGLNLYGNNDADTIIGGSGDDNVYGNEGGNRLNGRGGNDILFGGNNGDEILLGEDGDDVIFSNNGNDTVIGGHGSDQLYGTGGADFIFGDDSWGVDLPPELLGGDLTTPGQGVSARLEIVNTWWGGFEGRITITADRSIGEWKLALRSLFSLETVWGAAADQTSPKGAKIGDSNVYDYDLTNAAWNGSLANGQTTTIGFTARTHIAGAVDAQILQKAVSVAAAGDELPPVTPIPSTGAMDLDQPINVISTWPGGFEGQVTIEADQFVTEWKLLLRSEFEIKNVWGAEVALVRSEDGAFLYSLQNTKWNGVLQPNQKITIGFTAKTAGVPTDGEINSATLSLAEDEGLINQTAAGGGRKLVGGSGNDTFYSSAKKDIFLGAEGKDVFVFGEKLNKNNVDQVTDFNVKADSIYLENAIFTKLGKKGSESKPAQLSKKFFSLEKAKDKDDYIIYSKKKGILYYDADGSGSKKAVEFAKLDKNLKINEKDFFTV